MKRVWIVLNNDGTTILCDSRQEMNCYANLSSTQCLEGPYILSAERIRQERDFHTTLPLNRNKKDRTVVEEE